MCLKTALITALIIMSDISIYAREFKALIQKETWQYIPYEDHAGVRYIPMVDYNGNEAFPDQSDLWKSTGYAEYTDKSGVLQEFIYLGVTNHANRLAIYEYSINNNRISLIGELSRLLNLSMNNWQGKIHSYFIQNPNDGLVYFGTESGEHKSRIRTHALGYHGGLWCSLNPKTKEV
ncbi:MAG: hypothetical protein ABIA63_08025, partial [bacterium]